MSSSRDGPRREINVTPLVDVCLVLLIIFMVLLPRAVPEVSVRVPAERPPPTRPPPEAPLVLGLNADGEVRLNGEPMARQVLEPALTRSLEHRDRRVVFVDFDFDAPYGAAVEVLGIARRAGAGVLVVTRDQTEPTPDSLVGL